MIRRVHPTALFVSADLASIYAEGDAADITEVGPGDEVWFVLNGATMVGRLVEVTRFAGGRGGRWKSESPLVVA